MGECLKNDVQVFMMFILLKVESKAMIGDLLVVCDIPEVFPYDISDFLPKREVKFAVDLVPGTSHVSMAPCRTFGSEMSELKIQLKDFLEKKFVGPSVLPRKAPMLLVKKKYGSIRLYVDYR